MEISFDGHVAPATCECHKGKFFVFVHLIHPTGMRLLIGSKEFDSEKEAEDNLDAFTMEKADEQLRVFGLKKDEAKKITITNGIEMVPEIKLSRESNPNLH